MGLRLSLIKTHHHALRLASGLAGEDETLVDFPLFERVVFVHADFAFDHFGAAGAADAAFAGIGQIEAGIEGGVEHGALIAKLHGVGFAVEDDF